MNIDERREGLVTIAIIALFVGLALAFSSGPIFEGPDEQGHYAYIRYLIQNRSLPDVAELPTGQWFHAPLYYVLAMPVMMVAGEPSASYHEGLSNPYISFHSADAFAIPGNDNKNFCLHSSAEAFPYTESGVALQVHLVRLLSIVLGTCTVLSCMAVFRLVWPENPERRMLALAFVAFWPQFIYVSSLINNDNLLTLLATLSLWIVLRQLRRGPSLRSAVALGVVLGLALLTKVSALFLVLPVGIAAVLDWRRTWKYSVLTLLLVIAVAGWWYTRNMILYGDPILEKVILTKFSHEAIPPGGELNAIITHMPIAYQRLWARFGWNSVAVGEPIYRFFDGVVLLTIAGLVVQGVRMAGAAQRREADWGTVRIMAVLAAFGCAWVAMLTMSCATLWYCGQGRYLLPGIAGWAAIIALGLDAFTPHRLRLPVALGTIVVLATVASICLFGYFLPAYRPSPLPGRIEHSLSLRYEDAAELIGVQSDVVHARPGETVYITLYWRAIQPTNANLTAFVHSVGSNVVFRDSFPATGNLLSTDWLPGQTWAEKYIVVIPQDAREQAAYPLMAGLYETDTQRALAATGADGREVTPLVGQIVINGPSQPFDPEYRFGDVIGLDEPKITRDGDALKVCLRWGSLARTPTDYHVFVHVLSDGGDLIAQADFQHKNGLYPTNVWMPGEAIDDCVALDAPSLPDKWKVAIGLYELPSGVRLPVVDRAGRLLDNGMVVIAPQ